MWPSLQGSNDATEKIIKTFINPKRLKIIFETTSGTV